MLQNLSAAVWGDQIVQVDLPRVEGYFDAQLVPLKTFPDNDPAWGVYRSDGFLIEAAAYTRGPGRQLLGQSEKINEKYCFQYIDATGIYGGFGNYHFGHYLLSTLSRFWVDLRNNTPEAKIYMHIIGELEDWASIPFIEKTLSALNIALDDIVPIKKPLKIRRLLVPAPSFIEQSTAFQIFSEVGHNVGKKIFNCSSIGKRSEPVYLSKEHLKSGVWNLDNESIFVKVLQTAGIRVVYPEKLSLADQLRVFAEHKTIIGLSGSAFHLSLLSEGGHNIIGICHSPSINSNFKLLDSIKSNKASYFYADRTLNLPHADPGFSSTFRFSDPQKIGEEVLGLLN